MTRRLPLRLGVIACALATTAGSVAWKSACGCVPARVGLSEDLGITALYSFEEPDALKVVKERTLARLRARGESIDLRTVRSLGDTFNESCVRRSVETASRCTFWLWYRPGEVRGIEVVIEQRDQVERLLNSDVRVAYVTGSS